MLLAFSIITLSNAIRIPLWKGSVEKELCFPYTPWSIVCRRLWYRPTLLYSPPSECCSASANCEFNDVAAAVRQLRRARLCPAGVVMKGFQLVKDGVLWRAGSCRGGGAAGAVPGGECTILSTKLRWLSERAGRGGRPRHRDRVLRQYSPQLCSVSRPSHSQHTQPDLRPASTLIMLNKGQ